VAGYAVLAAQLLFLCAWSLLLWRRYALTWDFGVYHQPWFLIAHGHLDPPTTIESMPFWRNDAEFTLWPLAAFYWLLPHDVGLLWLQDAGVVTAEAVAFAWICDLTARRGKDAAFLAGAGLILLVASPWIWWSVSFDFHMESVAIPFAILLARDLAAGRRRMWWWVLPVLSSGAPEAVYVLGIGAGAALCGRRYWWRGGVLAMIGVAYSGLIIVLHADNGAPLARHYGYLAVGAAAAARQLQTRLTTGEMARAIAGHPLRLVQALWAKRSDTIAAVLPGGALGLVFRPLAPVILLALLSSVLSAGWRFAQPSFQMLPVYIMIPVGSIAALTWMVARWRRTAIAVAVVLAAQAVVWAAVWYPQVPVHWLRVSPAAAAELARIRGEIPATGEVIASQGILGPFTGRPDVGAITDQSRLLVDQDTSWFVIAPQAGTEIQLPASAMALIAELAGPLHATLIGHGNGVWAFRWQRPPGQKRVNIPDGTGAIPGWVMAGAAGRAVTSGPASSWYAQSDGKPGYVTDGLVWLEPPGVYTARVRLSTASGARVEVWDDNGQAPVLLGRRYVPGGQDTQTVTIPVAASARRYFGVFSGWGPFSATFVPALPGQRLEIRVWTDGTGTTTVYTGALSTAP
jgi:hypothetical protein